MKQLFTLVLCTFIATGLSAQQDTAKKEFKPSGKVWGYAFGDYFYKMHNDSANRGNTQYAGMPEGTNAFEFRRVYLGYDYNISERFSSEMLISYEGGTNSDGTRGIFLKAANVRWKDFCCNGTDLIFGLQATPAFPILAEKIWGLRAIEKMPEDMRKVVGSTDLGIGLQGKKGKKIIFGYDLLVGNGSGTKLESDIFKKVYGDIYLKMMDQKLIFDLYGDYEQTHVAPGFHKNKHAYKFTAFYTTDAFTVGLEAFIQNQDNYIGYSDTTGGNLKTDTTHATLMGFTGYVKARIIKDKLSFYARYDMYNPDIHYNNTYVYVPGMSSSAVTENFIVAGFDYTPVKNVHIMPNLWYESYASRAKGASGKVKSDYDMVPRITFWYVFK